MMSQRARHGEGRFLTVVLAASVAVSVALACSAGGDTDRPYGGAGTGGGSSGTDGGPVSDAITDGVLDSAGGASGQGGATGGTGGALTGGAGGGAGAAATGGWDSGGPGGWENCIAKPLPDGGMPDPVSVVLSGAPGDAASKFGGTVDSSRAPTLVYPADGTMMPPNIATLDVQFLPGTGNDLFEVSFESPSVNLHVYSTCNSVSNGCSVKVAGTTWADEIAKKAAGMEPLTVRVRGVSASNPATMGESATRALHISEQLMLGGIYYWDAAGQVVRYDFGHPTAQGEKYYTQLSGGTMCVGCHSLSPPGNLIAVGLGIPSPSVLRVLDVGTKNQRFQLNAMEGSNFQAFSPDENEIITSNGANMVWRNAYNGQPANPNPLVTKGTMPDYHPDMTMIVFARPEGFMAFPAPGIDNASLYLLHRNGTTWGPEELLVKAANGSENNYYPAFSPEGTFVLFNRSAQNNSYLAPDSMTWVVPTVGGSPIALAKANLNDQVGNSWPKWAPHKQCSRGRRILWYTVSSARDYGLRIQNPPLPSDPDAGDPRRWQIWMAAFDFDAALNGEDPSYPAFWLPFQDSGTGNHIAQWAEKVVRRPCLTDNDCLPAEHCFANECLPD